MSDLTIANLHRLTTRHRVPDDLLFARVYERISSFIDGDDVPLAVAGILSTGRGRLCWWRREPPQRQINAMIGAARVLDRQARPHTGGAWLVAGMTWNDLAADGPRYDSIAAWWKDLDGDMPFFVEDDRPLVDFEFDIGGLPAACIASWMSYGNVLRDSGVTPQEMVPKVKTGRGYHLQQGETFDGIMKAIGHRPAV